MNSDLLLDTTIGSLSKELMKARQDALVKATEQGYSRFRWIIYSESTSLLHLEAWKKCVDDTGYYMGWAEVARIELNIDMRPEHPANKQVNVIYL